MACFLVGGAEAVAVTVIKKVVERKELESGAATKVDGQLVAAQPGKLLWSRKIGWLLNMLWGGVLLLAVEHVWHGEVVPWFPFLTAMGNPADKTAMFHEMATIGGGMAVLVTAVWGVMVLVADRFAKRAAVYDQADAPSGSAMAAPAVAR